MSRPLRAAGGGGDLGPAPSPRRPPHLRRRVDGGAADPDPPTRLHGLRGLSTMESANDNALWRNGNPNLPFSFSAAPRSDDKHSGAEGRARVRQSFLYSDRPRHSRPRRLARAEEHVTALSSVEPASPVMNLPTFEALSLSDPPLAIPEKSEEIYDDCDEMSGDFGQSVPYTYYPKGLSRSMVLSLGSSLVKTVSTEKQPTPDLVVDIEEQLRLFKEYAAARPKGFWQAVAEVKANERATLAALATERRTEGLREAPQQASVAAYPQLSMSQRASRYEASEKETHQTGNEWMNKEVMLCFKKYIERSPALAGLVDYDLDELQHQCFNVESYDKVFHHYNFKVRMKMPNSVDWTVQLYFAEAKEVLMRKYYVCYPLQPNENGCCYACKSQGVENLRHPAIDVFEKGSRDSPPCGLWYTDE
ncbi:unnamed protein product [Urochloa decumbens]|uniref:DUF3615 domain-containing protein n=1 Tax=Urochloa decumbens TaxID=240449 RepID=A0ABC9AMR1_9POAL